MKVCQFRTPKDILEDIWDHLNNCRNDISVTHRVISQDPPRVSRVMPHLGVIFSGILAMGFSFPTADEGWERYLGNVEQT